MLEALGKRLRKLTLPNLRLRLLDGIRHAAKPSSTSAEIQLEPCRAGISVARLADRARVEDPAALDEVDLGALRREPAGELVRDQADRKREVAVPDEDDRRLGHFERVAGGLLGDHVFPDRVPRARVVELDVLLSGLRSKALEVGTGLVEQHRLRPAG